MRKKRVLITGGNDGIGRATARILIERGCTVIIAGRHEQKCQAAVASLRHQTNCSPATIDYLLLDLADLSSTREAAKDFQARFDWLDVLINNAGTFTDTLQLTKDGYERQFAVNHLGHFLLTDLLLPSLRAARRPRIINVASVAHIKGQLDFDSFIGLQKEESYSGLVAYAQSKLANVMFTRELARRYPDILSNCLHPGVVRTRIANKDTRWKWSLPWSLYKPFMRSAHCGARTSVYLAMSPEVNGVSGRYFDERQCCRKPARQARDEVLANQLWEVSEEMVAEFRGE